MKDKCEWKLNKYSNKYYSGCKGLYLFPYNIVKDIRFKYCPYCGKEIKEK